MKKLLFMFSIVAFLAIGCNTSQPTEAPATNTNMLLKADDNARTSNNSGSPTSNQDAQTIPLPPSNDKPSKPNSSLATNFSLHIGQEKLITQGLSLKFTAVTEDSRCPENTQCVWAGRVTVASEITDNSGKHNISFMLPGHDIEQSGSIKIRLTNLTPAPIAGQTVSKSLYTAHFEVMP